MRIALCALKSLGSGVLDFLHDLLRFAYFVVDLFTRWRSSLCLAVGIPAAVAAYILLQHPWTEAIAFVTIIALSLYVGWRWERSA